MAAFERFLAKNQPDAVLTFGNGVLGRAMAALAKRRDIPVVLAVHNFAYDNPADFRHSDYVTVPSRFSSEYYRQRLGLHCHVLPNVVDPQRVMATDRQPQYLTFVNPQPAKGLFVFARIADEMFRRRPDIPILVIEGRGRGNALEQTGLDLSRAKNLFSMANTPDPRKFYRVTKLLIMPSLWNESFGLVAAEAMSNGIPVLASDRGSLPEVVAEGGLLFNIPDRYTPETTDVPSADEVEPWVDAVVRLWDDTGFYRRQSQIAAMHARQWHPDRLRAVYVEFFRNLQPQPGPPIVPPPHTSAGGQSERCAWSDRLEVIQVEPTTRCNFHCRFVPAATCHKRT